MNLIDLALCLLLFLPFLLAIMDSALRLIYILAQKIVPEKSAKNQATYSLKIFYLILACNEEKVIGETLARLNQVLNSTIGSRAGVLCDHCTDQTGLIAQINQVPTFIRHVGKTGKGPALSWFAQTKLLELKDFDVIVILDADTLIDVDFHQNIQKPFSVGAKVVQAFIQPVFTTPSPAILLASYSELLSQYIDDQARMKLGWSIPLRGTGMAFCVPIFIQICQDLGTQVEDIEISLLLDTNKVKVSFEPSAIVYDAKSAQLLGLARQRGRWLKGQREVVQAMGGNIWRIIGSGMSGLSLIQALLLKPKTSLMLIKFSLLFVAIFALPFPPVFHLALITGLVISLTIDFIYFFSGLSLVAQPRKYLSALLRSPIFLLVWLAGWLYSILPGQGWLRGRDV